MNIHIKRLIKSLGESLRYFTIAFIALPVLVIGSSILAASLFIINEHPFVIALKVLFFVLVITIITGLMILHYQRKPGHSIDELYEEIQLLKSRAL